jgi:very-short-patch-repair endonuclease
MQERGKRTQSQVVPNLRTGARDVKMTESLVTRNDKRAERIQSLLSRTIEEWNRATMIPPDGPSDEAVLAVLDRHEQRRCCDVPTISVLVGPGVLSLCLFSQWAETRDRPVVSVQVGQADPELIVVPWVDELARRFDLGMVAIHWLARRLHRDDQTFERSLRLMTSYELEIFLERSLPLQSQSHADCLGRRLIECAVTGIRPGGPDFARELDVLLGGYGHPWIRVFRAIGELIDQDHLPSLVISLANMSVPGLDRIARLLTEFASAQPRTGLVLLIEQEQFDRFVALAPDSRAKALLLESLVTLAGNGLSMAAGPVSTLANGRQVTSDDPLADDLKFGTEDFKSPRRSSGDDDEARSAAERFLYERLESTSETAGLFELNAMLDFQFGSNRWIEVDLAARSLKLAVEVDGYHHFHDPEAFRRDRRKDVVLQKQGYLVVRVLAEDVVERLEEVMGTIFEAVVFRRAAASDRGATP